MEGWRMVGGKFLIIFFCNWNALIIQTKRKDENQTLKNETFLVLLLLFYVFICVLNSPFFLFFRFDETSAMHSAAHQALNIVRWNVFGMDRNGM